MTQYQTKPVDLVDSLRQVADLLATMTDVELPQFFVDLGFTVSSHKMDSPEQEDERVAAVCTLMAVLTPGLQAAFWPGSSAFGTPMGDPMIGGLNVSVHTHLNSAKERQLREENARLREQLDKVGGKA